MSQMRKEESSGGHPQAVLEEVFSRPFELYEEVGNRILEDVFKPEYEPHLPSTSTNESKYIQLLFLF